MTDLYYLSQADGVGEWRVKEAKDLSDLVQNRITYLQVPTDAPAAPPTGLVQYTLSLTHTHTYKSMVSIYGNVSLTGYKRRICVFEDIFHTCLSHLHHP